MLSTPVVALSRLDRFCRAWTSNRSKFPWTFGELGGEAGMAVFSIEQKFASLPFAVRKQRLDSGWPDARWVIRRYCYPISFHALLDGTSATSWFNIFSVSAHLVLNIVLQLRAVT
jgi:hypothetical protein